MTRRCWPARRRLLLRPRRCNWVRRFIRAARGVTRRSGLISFRSAVTIPTSICTISTRKPFLAGASWRRDNWTVSADFDYTRLLATSDYDEFYAEYAPRWSRDAGVPRMLPEHPRRWPMKVRVSFYLMRRNSGLPGGNDFYSRLDEGVDVSINYAALCSHVIVQSVLPVSVYVFHRGCSPR